MSQRRGRSRGVFVAGGAALVALGLWFGGLFNGFGPGSGKGDGDGDNTRPSAVGPENDDDPITPDPADGDADVGPLRVVLVPNGYALATEKDGKKSYADATIREVVADAVATEDQPDGYRVIITSRAGVSAGAHQDLVRQLEAAGLKPDEILGYDSKDVAAE